ncbi:MAG: NHLP leader peptide family RiPP precursor [Pseudomonadales bacterium]|nr:NHLP leader peptide family RiPP precursor [Pseudomonadales bacterium]
MISLNELRNEIIERATTDAEFRQRLVADPRSLLGTEFGVQLPDEFELRIHEDTFELANVVLPPMGRLGDDELEAVVGGAGDHIVW